MDEKQHKESNVHAAPKRDEAPMTTEELESVFREHHAQVLAAAYRVTGNRSDAEDVLQTVFLRLLRREAAPDLSQTPAAYMRRAAINKALDVVRSRVSARAQALEALPSFEARDARPAPDRQLLGREAHERLRAALAELSSSTAETFALRYFEGYSNQEIAHMTGASQGAVGVSLHRARHKLKDLLALSEGE